MKTFTLDMLVHAAVTIQAEHEDAARRKIQEVLDCATVALTGLNAAAEMSVDLNSIKVTEVDSLAGARRYPSRRAALDSGDYDRYGEEASSHLDSDIEVGSVVIEPDQAAPQDGEIVGWLVRKGDSAYSDFPASHRIPDGEYLLKAVLPQKQAAPQPANPEMKQLVVWLDVNKRILDKHITAGDTPWADLVKSAQERAPTLARFWYVLPLNKL